VRGTRRLKLVTEFEASWGSSVYAAKNAASFQRYSAGRFAWHLQAGAASRQRRKNADPVSDEDVLPRIGEFLQVARGVLTQAPFSFKGRFFEVQNGGFKDGLDHQPVPQVYWSGTSRAALELSAEHADVHVLSPAAARRARSDGPDPKTARGSANPDPALRIAPWICWRVRRTVKHFAMRSFPRPDLPSHRWHPTIEGPGLWDGLSTARTGAASVLVGSYGRVAEELSKYQESASAVSSWARSRTWKRPIALARTFCLSCDTDIGSSLHRIIHSARRIIMSIDIFWRIPYPRRAGLASKPDTQPVGPVSRLRGPGVGTNCQPDYSYIDYLAEIAHAAEIAGFQGGLIPSFPMTDEPWVISSVLARETRTFRFMIPVSARVPESDCGGAHDGKLATGHGRSSPLQCDYRRRRPAATLVG
jgi:alkanesulfonate monooxygenase SsuD/methylene tetrahydromethanopterin reductase-like flavin-dependent oxidoreductase (luciferase family)